jgi:hypothetical protein
MVGDDYVRVGAWAFFFSEVCWFGCHSFWLAVSVRVCRSI